MKASTVKILVVDDERGPRESLRILLKQDYDVVVSSSGREAMRIVQGGDVKLAIVDLKMKGMDGIKTLQEIKKITPSTKVVLLTGYGDAKSRALAKKFGASKFLDKPFDIGKMKQVIRELLAGSD